MVLMESAKVMAGTWFFFRSIFRSLQEYLKDDNKSEPKETPPRGKNLNKVIPDKLPSAVDIKKVIPKHCFDPKVTTSMYYAIKDMVLVALTFAAILAIHQVAPPLVWYPSLFVYWCLQGTLFTAVFVIGHDCGHGSFSHYPLLNDIVGTVMHSFLLCPFYMWKLSHRLHHRFTNNFDKDEVYYPIRESEPASKGKVIPGFGFGIGWFFYLIKGYSPRSVPHFDVSHPFFQGHRVGVVSSLMTFLLMASGVSYMMSVYGLAPVFNYYFVPLFIFASYTVIITFLHHHEVNIPWYSDDKWDFVRGQLSTIDRHYGFVHHIIHNIGTHQMHHMFTKIPHYHLEEATVHFRKHYHHLVKVCEEPILPSFMRMFRKYAAQCQMSDDTKKHIYH